MSSNLRTVKADIQEFLETVTPNNWLVMDAEKVGSQKLSKIGLTYEQLDISAEALGQELPSGWVWVSFQLVLSTPETDAVKGIERLTGVLADFLLILDASPELRWTDATRTRLDTGESAYIIPIALLAETTPPAPEPIPTTPEE